MKVRIDSLKTGDSTQLFTASGTPLFVVGKCDIEINFSGLLVPHTVLIVRNLQENFILGTDFMRQNKVILDF